MRNSDIMNTPFGRLHNKRILWFEEGQVRDGEMVDGKIWIDFGHTNGNYPEGVAYNVYVCQNKSAGSDCGARAKAPFKYSYVYSIPSMMPIKTVLERLSCKLKCADKKEFKI